LTWEGYPMFHLDLLNLVRQDEAVTAVEYAVMLALILVVVMTAISAVGNSTSGIWANDTGSIQSSIAAS
jgi:pilus assembly protein Flp/PilA